MTVSDGFARQRESNTKLGFHQSHYDYSLFTRQVDSDILVVLGYVDDLLVTGSNTGLVEDTKRGLQKQFKMKDLGELKFFLGIECARSSQGIHMSQRKYALKLIAECGLGGAKPIGTPLEHNKKLTSVKYDEHISHEGRVDDQLLQQPEMYQRLVGRVLYLTMTRPDIAFSVQVLSQYMHNPKKSHMESVLRVVRYLKEALGLGLLMSSKYTNTLTAYYDSDWGACLETRRFVTGYLVKFGGSLISWKSKKQETVSRS
ncbi:uncharacterized mitochondrial protein AtMg00810-like [Solanum dulcamara]|uniref:uncharacterized mitochondrial protein AtMg00810-like n=1 Tax=Solanum dulcamara TaxID=45834 RepID=UPI0024869D0B|nr:uncharacterized mitochondrial protein AtMg00810-like [Solanum dulcamara]